MEASLSAIERIDVTVTGGTLATFRLGDAPGGTEPVLAVHGITANSRSWLAVARALAGRAALLAPDLRGRAGVQPTPRSVRDGGVLARHARGARPFRTRAGGARRPLARRLRGGAVRGRPPRAGAGGVPGRRRAHRSGTGGRRPAGGRRRRPWPGAGPAEADVREPGGLPRLVASAPGVRERRRRRSRT